MLVEVARQGARNDRARLPEVLSYASATGVVLKLSLRCWEPRVS
jgi:hypothetical protein